MSDSRIYHDGEPFPGRGLTLADSEPAWPVSRRAPTGAPNVVLVVLDDVGFAQLGCYASDRSRECPEDVVARLLDVE